VSRRKHAINFDWFWSPELDGYSRVRQVYRNDKPIGRVRRWQEDDARPTHEWFTVERKKGRLYEPIEGEHATFEGALERVIFYAVAQ